MAGANGFYSPPSPLKVCQGPAYTTHHCSVRCQALTFLPPPIATCLLVILSLRLLQLYRGISDVLRELFDDWDNDAIWSELSQHFITKKNKKNREKNRSSVCKKTPKKRTKFLFLSWILACISPAIQSHPILLTSIRITPRLQVCHRGDVRHHASPAEQPFHAPA